jgi:hypothetical protein
MPHQHQGPVAPWACSFFPVSARCHGNMEEHTPCFFFIVISHFSYSKMIIILAIHIFIHFSYLSRSKMKNDYLSHLSFGFC